MRAGFGLIGLLVAVLLVIWLARPARVDVPPAPPSGTGTGSGEVLPHTGGRVSPDEFRRALDDAVKPRAMPSEAQ
jgi:hypothetical protein